MSKRDVVVLSAARWAVGTFGGSLSDIEPSELAGIVMKEAVHRSGADPKVINYVTVGNTIPTEGRSAYVARLASIQAGLPMESVAMAVNRLLVGAADHRHDRSEHPARRLRFRHRRRRGGHQPGAYISTAMRSGARMGDTNLVDMMVATLPDPFRAGHMGITAENLATKWVISREEQDALAAESHHRAAAAIKDGRFKSQIAPVVKKTRKGDVVVDTDEHVKPGTTAKSWPSSGQPSRRTAR